MHSRDILTALRPTFVPTRYGLTQTAAVVAQHLLVEGRQRRVEVSAPPPLVATPPTIILESGLGTPLENWDRVVPTLAGFARTVTHDRAGIGGSEPGKHPPTPERNARTLHALLEQLDVEPPYFLIGHSLGGVFIRAFQCLYPDEVAGLVYVDSTDFTETRAERRRLWKTLGVGSQGEQAIKAVLQKFIAEAPPGLKPEVRLFARLRNTDYAELHQLAPCPLKPTTLLLAARVDADPENAAILQALDVDHYALQAAELEGSLIRQSRWLQAVGHGTLAVTARSGHYIQLDEPEMVLWGLLRTMKHWAADQLLQAGVDAAAVTLADLKRRLPADVFDESLLDGVGNDCLRQGDTAAAIALLQLNVQDHPQSWKSYDSLGAACSQAGQAAAARAAYARSLALNPGNVNAARRLGEESI